MPLPKLPLGQRDFALITIEQKRELDNRFTEEECLMEPQEFREIVMEMTIQNGFDSFVRLLNLSCGKSYFGKRCMIFVVPILSDIKMDKLRKKNLLLQSMLIKRKCLGFQMKTFKIHTLLELLCLEVNFFQQTATLEWIKLLS